MEATTGANSLSRYMTNRSELCGSQESRAFRRKGWSIKAYNLITEAD
jgi:hypothetical protein